MFSGPWVSSELGLVPFVFQSNLRRPLAENCSGSLSPIF